MTKVEVLERDAEGRATLVQSEMDVDRHPGEHAAALQLRRRRRPFTGRARTETSRRWTGSWRFAPSGEAPTEATYALEIGLGRRLALLVKTVRGPVRDRVESLLTDRPVEGLKARAERAG